MTARELVIEVLSKHDLDEEIVVLLLERDENNVVVNKTKKGIGFVYLSNAIGVEA